MIFLWLTESEQVTCWLNKGRGLKFRVGPWIRQETPEEDRRIHRPKRCEYNYKDEDNSPKNLKDKKTKALFNCL